MAIDSINTLDSNSSFSELPATQNLPFQPDNVTQKRSFCNGIFVTTTDMKRSRSLDLQYADLWTEARGAI